MPTKPPSADVARKHQLHGLQPVLPVSDVEASAAFFKNVLGFEVEFLRGSPAVHGRVKSGDGSYGQPIYVHLSKASAEQIHPTGELRIHVGSELDALFSEYVRRGAQVISLPVSQPWGLREFVLREPNGYLLRFCAET
jgi:catechol 2,3-dioxygenase-like lactoylglutathione lyase family enzyme